MGSGSSALNYKPDEELPKKIAAPAEVYFYGMGKPLDKDGKDKGLKEIWESWAFPKSGDSSVVIRPAVEGVHNDWSQRRFSMEYDKRLSAYGLDEAGFQEIIEKLNTLLRAFYPFQRDRKLAKKTKQSERGFNEDQKGIDSHTSTFYYAVEMRKILAKVQVHSSLSPPSSLASPFSPLPSSRCLRSLCPLFAPQTYLHTSSIASGWDTVPKHVLVPADSQAHARE
jgi:hypothetical protein